RFSLAAILGGLSGLCASGSVAGAEQRPTVAPPPPGARVSDVDTEHMFGDTTGSDIEEPGNLVPHLNSRFGFGKRGRLYSVIDQNIELKYGLM
ncbi:hypothetical protein, partial [Stenotrophomonas maltophilia]|uniref:hypothetical protein n=1 Tax=Stenotrophomonas maltophilia TaxID=40324 RepID=UPI001954F6C7